MTDTKAFALIPAYSHIDPRLMETLGRTGTPTHTVYRCSDLPKARSQLLTFGLERTDAEVFLLIDSDIVPTAEQLCQLRDSPKLGEWSAVTGAYVLPSGAGAFVPSDLDGAVMLGEPGFTSLRSAGLGFCAIHRTSLMAMTRALPRIEWQSGEWWPFCVPLVRWEGGIGRARYYPDDHVLWMRHEAEGGLLWLDQTLLVAHCYAEPRRPLPGPVTRG